MLNCFHLFFQTCPGDQGKSHKPAYVLLVGTHADLAPARKNSSGEFSSPTQGILREKVRGYA